MERNWEYILNGQLLIVNVFIFCLWLKILQTLHFSINLLRNDLFFVPENQGDIELKDIITGNETIITRNKITVSISPRGSFIP